MPNSAIPVLDRLAAPAAYAAAGALAASGFLQLGDTPSSGEAVTGVEHLTLALLTGALVLLVPVLRLLAHQAADALGAALACAGMLGYATLAVVANVRSEDPWHLAEAAVPASALWLGGLVALAVALRSSGRVPRAVALLLPATWAFSLPLAAAGGGVIAAAYWLVVGWLAANDALAGRPTSVATP